MSIVEESDFPNLGLSDVFQNIPTEIFSYALRMYLAHLHLDSHFLFYLSCHTRCSLFSSNNTTQANDVMKKSFSNVLI